MILSGYLFTCVHFVSLVCSIAYMGPGVTTYQNLNMGYRIYTIDGAYNGSTSVSLEYIKRTVHMEYKITLFNNA